VFVTGQDVMNIMLLDEAFLGEPAEELEDRLLAPDVPSKRTLAAGAGPHRLQSG
jgi:hypothetical protein